MSSLRDILKLVQQEPKHHPEGDVFTHVRMVRRSLDDALGLLREAAAKKDSVLAHLDLNLTREETDILRVAAWLHDVGKVTATTWDEGKGWRAIGHDRPRYFLPALRSLGVMWRRIWVNSETEAKKDVLFLTAKHMTINLRGRRRGFGRRRSDRWIDEEGTYHNRRRIKLLLILIVMDRLGRGVADPQGSAEQAIEAMEACARARHKRVLRPPHVQPSKAPDSPVAFLRHLHALGKYPAVLRQAFNGKFNREPNDTEWREAGCEEL